MQTEWQDPPAERFTSQAEGKHPAPCARFCEANAFGTEIRGWRAENERLKGERLVFAELMDAAAKVLHVLDGEDADEEAGLRRLQERLELASLQARGITTPNVKSEGAEPLLAKLPLD